MGRSWAPRNTSHGSVILKTSIHHTYFVFVPPFWRQILTKQNIASSKNPQRVFSIAGSRFEEK